MAVRRGVAPRGDRRLLPARWSACSSARARLTEGRSRRWASPRARRSARASGGRRAVPRLHARDAASTATASTSPAWTRTDSTTPPTRCAARRATTSGRQGEFERRGGDLLGAFGALRAAGAIDLWTSTATHAVLPLVATGQGAQLQLAAGIASHKARFGAWSGGLWLPECAYRPGLEEQLETAGVRAFCVDQTERRRRARPARAGTRRPPARSRSRSTGRRSRSSGTTPATPADPVYRDYHVPHDQRPAAVGDRRRRLRPRRRGRASPRPRAATSSRTRSRRLRRLPGRRGAARLCVSARSTPSCSATGGTRARLARRGVRGSRGGGPRLAHAPGGARAPRAGRAPAVESSWGAGQGPAHLGLARGRRDRWPRARPSCAWSALAPVAAAERRAGRGRARRARAARAPVERLGLHGDPRRSPPTIPSGASASHAAAFERAIAALDGAVRDFRAMQGRPPTEPSLRGLAPDLRPGAARWRPSLAAGGAP